METLHGKWGRVDPIVDTEIARDRRNPVWKVRFCYAKGLRHANCLKTIDLLFFYCS